VKTGPTRGQNRSRNKDGRWREKRSDAGKSRDKTGSGGCFITAAACLYRGLPDDCKELQTLRQFRDTYILTLPNGARMIEEYYKSAPRIVPLLTAEEDFAEVWTAITKSVALIDSHQPAEALAVYEEMVSALKRKFGNV
jgi:hypothetical protein